ncbi:NGFI-A-binding protein homolog isoform X2 [Venturia canescens]|uniref:NGFI-A-binding protein homolog isoform X2 n=1 Tax=Venturia canescens TaxID=32260 RepID=UPI001C9C947A|nr:NGFI-A-binding protein homolog isoform X2 [Venturia canescens]
MESRITGLQGIVGVAETPRGVATPSPVQSSASCQQSSQQTTVGTTITPIATSSLSSTLNVASLGHITSVSMNQTSLAAVVTTPSVTQQHQTTASGLPRILSRNVNGTLVQTSVPQNEAELQLYRVMQRASLLGYYDTLLEMGGDDVQQLCDAGEEEFLEIMALVGMASKPLHVRRLQKALQEWITNPSLFQTPVVPTNANKNSTSGVSGFSCASPRSQQPTTNLSTSTTTLFGGNSQSTVTPGGFTTSQVALTPLPRRSASPVVPVANVAAPVATTTYRHSPSPNAPLSYTASHSPGILQVGTCESSCGSGTTPSPSGGGAPASPTQPTPSLLASQVQRLAEAAERLASTIRPLDPKPHNVKKKICKNLEMVMAIPESDPRRMEEIRKYAAIYGRFDCKRKPEKPLTLHEVSVNEAAAQICRFVPALLTRRDELFPLARRVVRDSGYHYSKSQYMMMTRSRENGDDSESERSKRRHLEPADGEDEDTSQAELDLRCSGSDGNNLNSRRHSSSSLAEEE